MLLACCSRFDAAKPFWTVMLLDHVACPYLLALSGLQRILRTCCRLCRLSRQATRKMMMPQKVSWLSNQVPCRCCLHQGSEVGQQFCTWQSPLHMSMLCCLRSHAAPRDDCEQQCLIWLVPHAMAAHGASQTSTLDCS